MGISPSVTRASGLRKKDLLRSNSSMLNQQSRVRSFHVRRLKQMDLTSRQKAAVRRHLWKRKRGVDGVMRWVRIDAQHSEAYADLSTPKHDSTDTRSRSSSSSSLKEHNAHIALALRDFGEDESLADFNPKPSFSEPLRATALKKLEEAEDRMSLAHHPFQNPYNKMSSLPTLQESETDDEDDMRRMNYTAVSTGYVRHENEAGGFEWAPAGDVPILASTRVIQTDEDLEEIAALTFHEKNRWFLKEVQKRWRSYDEGHIQFGTLLIKSICLLPLS